MNTIKPIFILGYMRSGTTLAFNVLGKHPDVFTRNGEPKIIEYLSMIRKIYPDLNNEEVLENYIGFVVNVIRFGRPMKHLGQPLIETQNFHKTNLQSILSKISRRDYLPIFFGAYDYLAGLDDKHNWCIKLQAVDAEAILVNLPQSYFIEVVRDPRDVMASKKLDRDAVWHSERYKPEERASKALFNTYDPLWDSLSWRAEIRTGRFLREKYPERSYSIRYEDLVVAPGFHIKKMCDFLRIGFDENMLDINKRNSSVWEKKYTGIGSESVEKWRKNLTLSEVILIQTITRREMKIFGYGFEDVPFLQRLWACRLMFVSLAEFFQRLVKRYKLGGWSYFLNVITLYWKKLR